MKMKLEVFSTLPRIFIFFMNIRVTHVVLRKIRLKRWIWSRIRIAERNFSRKPIVEHIYWGIYCSYVTYSTDGLDLAQWIERLKANANVGTVLGLVPSSSDYGI